MEVFNRYPVRYPKLQAPLGTFLATASQECLHTYIYSINLTILEAKPDQNRTTIAICFEQFWRVADKEQRTILWRLAFQRWTEWDFDQNDDNTQLVWICWSPLDYAIVAYAREVLDETERQALLLRWTNELSMLDTRWFASHTDMISSWNRLLSCFQPVAHALTVEDTAEGWLNERATFLPFDGVVKDFVSLRYRMR